MAVGEIISEIEQELGCEGVTVRISVHRAQLYELQGKSDRAEDQLYGCTRVLPHHVAGHPLLSADELELMFRRILHSIRRRKEVPTGEGEG